MRWLVLGLALCVAEVPPGVAVLSHDDLLAGGKAAEAAVRLGFAGDAAFSLLIVKDIPGFAEARRAAFNATIDLARSDNIPLFSRRPRSTWPGFRHRGHVNDPLQGGFLHNLLEEVGPARVEPVFGRNVWPTTAFRDQVVAVNERIHNVTHAVLRLSDALVNEEAARVNVPPPATPLGMLLEGSDFLYSLLKIYRAEFSRGDDLFDSLQESDAEGSAAAAVDAVHIITGGGNASSATPSNASPLMRAAASTCSASPAPTGAGAALSSMRTHAASSRSPAAALSSMRTHAASSRPNAAAITEPVAAASTCSASPAPTGAGAALSSMRTHAASSRANAAAAVRDASAKDVEPFWLPWHIDPNTISTLTGDEFFHFESATTWDKSLRDAYPQRGLGLVVSNALGQTARLSPYIDDSSLVVMMAAGAQVHTGGLLRGCLHAVERSEAPTNASRIMYYQAWYGPSGHKFAPPEGSNYTVGGGDAMSPSVAPAVSAPPPAAANGELKARMKAIVDPIINSMQMRTSRNMLLDFRRQFQRLPEGNERDGSQSTFDALTAVLPPPERAPRTALPAPPRLTIDVVTDLSCPLAYLGLRRLRAAINRLSSVGVVLRFHMLLVNPDMDPGGEDMASYMRRRRNLSLAEYNEASYPLNQAAAALNYSYDNRRRVINPTRAHLAVAAAGETAAARAAAYEHLAARYFEAGDDISDVRVLSDALGALGQPKMRDELTLRRVLDVHEGAVLRLHRSLERRVDGVPTFVIREGSSGAGVLLRGQVPEVDEFERALTDAAAAAHAPPIGDGYGLLEPPGMLMAGVGGVPVRVHAVDRKGSLTLSGRNLDGWMGPEAWPYTEADFQRADESDDAHHYAEPNLVSHIDDAARAALTATYSDFFEAVEEVGKADGAPPLPLALLDTASSWQSHYPPIPEGSRVAVQGLNLAELQANPVATEHALVDLNNATAPLRLPYADASFDAVTNAAGVGYLTRPREFFSEIHRVLKPGGLAIIAFSNRVFEEKATKVWLDHMDEEAGLGVVVRTFFAFGAPNGWQNVTAADLSPHPTDGDPMYIVTAVKRVAQGRWA